MLIAHHEVAPVSRPKEKAARPRRVARISMPSALSVFRLMAGPMRTGLMSQLGLGRVKMAREGRRYREQKAEWVSGRDRSDQRLDPDDVHDPCQIVGQDRERHFSAYCWKRFGEKVCRSHAGLHRTERMLDCLSTLAHGLWICI